MIFAPVDISLSPIIYWISHVIFSHCEFFFLFLLFLVVKEAEEVLRMMRGIPRWKGVYLGMGGQLGWFDICCIYTIVDI